MAAHYTLSTKGLERLKEGYYNWRGLQPRGSALGEEAALRWGYEMAMRQAQDQVIAALFGDEDDD